MRYISNGLVIDLPKESQPPMPMTLSEKLRKLRKDKDWSLDDLATKANVSKSYLWELENRPERKPSAEKLTDIAVQLGVTVEFLLDDNATDQDDAQLQEAFFRKFNRLEEGDRDRIIQMVDVWSRKK